MSEQKPIDFSAITDGCAFLDNYGMEDAADAIRALDQDRTDEQNRCVDLATMVINLQEHVAELRAKLTAAVRVVSTAYPTTADEMNAVIRQIAEITRIPDAIVWSGYDDDECGFPLFETREAAQTYAEWQFRKDHGSAHGTDAYDLDRISFAEREAYTEAHDGRAGLFDLTTDGGSTGYAVCEHTVYKSADAAIRDDEAKEADQ